MTDRLARMPPPPSPFAPNVRRAELLTAEVQGDRCDLRLVYRNAPMRVRISRETARSLIAELTPFAEAP